MPNLTGLIGIAVLVLAAWAMSSHRRRFPWRIVTVGIALQIALAVLLLRVRPVERTFGALASLINDAIGASEPGAEFAWGWLAGERFIFVVHAMSVVIFFASLMSVLYHLGVMQRLVAALAWVLRRTLRVTGSEALCVAANVFVGQTEAPLCVRPYIDSMTRSQIMTLMVGGFATVSGSVLAVYVGMLGGDDPAQRELFIRHLLTASLMSAPAAFVMAKILVPETDTPLDEGLRAAHEHPHANLLDAAAAGATDGMKLAINIVAMLIAFVSLLALLNMPLAWAGGLIDARLGGGTPWASLSIETFLGWLFTPLAWVIGVHPSECPLFGSLLGQQLVLTELVAYSHLGEIIHDPAGPRVSSRTAVMATYALCAFANFASIAIQIGGLSAIAPSRRRDFVTLGPKAMIGGAFAAWMTAAIAGLFL